MTDLPLQVLSPNSPPRAGGTGGGPTPGPNLSAGPLTVALIGNPNAGKTLLFNALTGLRARTANFAGTTVEWRLGRASLPEGDVRVIDLPGLYGLDALSEDERVAARALQGLTPDCPRPDLVLAVIDSTRLERGLYLVAELAQLGAPMIVVLNMIDMARRNGVTIHVDRLAAELGCPVTPVSARTGEGLDALRALIGRHVRRDDLTTSHPADPDADQGDLTDVALNAAGSSPTKTPAPATAPRFAAAPRCVACAADACPYASRYDWAETLARDCAPSSRPASHEDPRTERIDRVLTHPIAGVIAFGGVMLGLFYLIFALAGVPMDLIDSGFGQLAAGVGALLPEGDLRSLIVDGVIRGVGGVLIFLPQIAILFLCITLLEDSGYLARAAFVMDRLLQRVGLPGKAFVPMLSAHACAIPAIMATRVIEDWRDRLATILVIPLMTCSARLPVYAMVVMLLFRDQPFRGALVFTGAYLLGIVTAVVAALCFKRTLLPGATQPMLIDLPPYRRPSLRSALMLTGHRCLLFARKAGTIILLLSVILWALATYPKLDDDQMTVATAQRLAELDRQAGAYWLILNQADENFSERDADLLANTAEQTLEAILREREQLLAREQLAFSVAGRLGRAVEPIFAPLGFDWRINVGVLSSFAAREVIVSTLSIVYGMGEEGAEDEARLTDVLASQTHEDGTPVFTTATSLSLLVFFVLAMQCLPTQVVTRRETGRWRWPLFQLAYMSVLAYVAALITYQVVSLF